jgi:hypothetical protein
MAQKKNRLVLEQRTVLKTNAILPCTRDLLIRQPDIIKKLICPNKKKVVQISRKLFESFLSQGK